MRHGRTHHEDQRIPCPECPGTFVDKYILKEHMASAHPKFTIPIEGTNVIGVGIGEMKKESPANKRKRTIPSHNPSPKRANAKNKDTPSPGKSRRSSGWHIPRLSPMVVAPVMEEKDDKEETDTAAGDTVAKTSPPLNDSSNNGEVNKDTLASMQVVFPGMDMMDIDNNNTLKGDEAADLSTGMQVVFPGMEMVQQQEDSNGPESDNSPAKERSVIETSDGEEAKISE